MRFSFAGLVSAALAVAQPQASAAQSVLGPDAELGFGLPTGTLAWTLPIATVPGDIPISVVFRYQASLPNAMGQWQWASLNFGYITVPGANKDQGVALEGTQTLEDGAQFLDTDWQGSIKDGNWPSAFGLVAPSSGYATDGSRGYGLYTASPEELGAWREKVSQLTTMNQFKVLMDRKMARIFGYHESLKVFVPVLWVDRFGHWVGFQWNQRAWAGGDAFTVQVANASGKGVQLSWAPQGASTDVVDLLRADFIGLPAPTLLVRGYSGLPSQPSSPSLGPVTPVAGGTVGRPTQVRLGSPRGLAVPGYVQLLPEASEIISAPMREWTFAYADDNPAELATLQDPMGLKSTFTFQSYRFPDDDAKRHGRGVSSVSSVDTATGNTQTQTWSREISGHAGAPWMVSHTSSFSGGRATEGRTTTYTFQDAGRGPAQAFLQSVQILGASGNNQMTTYELPGMGLGPSALPSRVLVTGAGKKVCAVLLGTSLRTQCCQ